MDSGDSLRALWIARYLPSGKERKRVLGVPENSRCLTSEAGLPARGWANTEVGTGNEATTRKHDVAPLAR